MIRVEKTNNTHQTISKLQKKYILLFIILSIVTFFLVDYIKQETKKSYLQQTTQTYERAYKTIYTQYQELSDVVFTGLLKLGDVKKTFSTLHTLNKEEQDLARIKLYDRIITRYKTLEKKHIRSVNFILADNSIFLKVKNPSQSGQTISQKRHIINYIKENKKPVSSFEIGKNGAGFRFAYPIIENGIYLGIVSITFGAEAFTSAIMKQYYVLSNFFISEKNFNLNLLEKKKHLYTKAHHKGFVFDKKVLKELKKITRKDIKEVRPNNKFIKELFQNITTNSKNATLFDEKSKSLFTHLPIFHTISKEKDAVIAIRSKGDAIHILNQNYAVILSLIIILIATILFLIYQYNIRLIKEKLSLQENMDKDKQLLEQAKMAQMGEMIGNIAHQWRQPLSTISTAASGMKVKHEYSILTTDEIPEQMDIIIKNVDYLSKTIDTFRNFIKEESVTTLIVLQDSINKTLEIISATLSQNHIKLINEIDYSNPLKLYLIPGALSQVIVNIMNNSKDAMVENNVENRWLKIKTYVENEYAVISIEDNGGGINEEILTKIFDPYFTTKHQSQGTGLGLFMSHKIVTQYFNGELSVINTKNGAKFFIKIPLQTKEENIELS